MKVVCLLLPLLVLSCTARPDGPPPQACSDMRPRHGDIVSQTSVPPVKFIWNATAESVIKPRQYIEVTLESNAGKTFKGFMIQARDTAGQRPIIGSFVPGNAASNYRTLDCNDTDIYSPQNTAGHVSNIEKHFVTVTWIAPQELPDEFTFYYTIVENYSTFWVMQESPDKLLGRTRPLPGDPMYIKLHGSLMTFAWGVLIPVGIILALFYKVVWPNGHWFYIHVAVMIVAVLMVITAVILILVHSEWKWLDTTDLNSSHQILGIIALIAVVVNPLLGFFILLECCSLGRKCRKVYNFCHGSIGLFFAEGVALGTMLIGVHILRDHPRDFDSTAVHNAIYSVSAITATVIMTIALYNGYHIRYHKDHPKPGDAENPLPSNDWWLRLIAGGGIILLLVAPVATAIYFLSTI